VRSSTSSSSHRLPDIGYRATAIAVSALLVFLLAALAALNALLDPFQHNRFAPALDIDRVALFRGQNTALWTVGEIGSALRSTSSPIDVLIVGDSRGRSLTGGWQDGATRLVRLDDGTVVLNAAFGGASLGEAIEMADALLDRMPPPRLIIFQTALDDISIPQDDRSIAVALSYLEQPWKYYFSIRTVRQFLSGLSERPPVSLRPALRPVSEPMPLPLAAARPPREAAVTLNSFDDLRPERIAEAQAYARRLSRGSYQEIQRNASQSILPFATRAQARGAEVLLFVPPMHPFIEQSALAQLGSFIPVLSSGLEEFTIYDGLSFDGYYSIFTFGDSVHFDQGVQILYDLIFCNQTDASFFSYTGGASPCGAASDIGDGVLSPVNRTGIEPVSWQFDGTGFHPICVPATGDFAVSISLADAPVAASNTVTDTTPPMPLRMGDLAVYQSSSGYRFQIGTEIINVDVDTSQRTAFDFIVIGSKLTLYMNRFFVAEFETAYESGRQGTAGLGYYNRHWTGTFELYGVPDREADSADQAGNIRMGAGLCD